MPPSSVHFNGSVNLPDAQTVMREISERIPTGVRRIRRELPGAAKGALPLTAPRTSINAAVHARRRVAFAAASLADAKELKNELDQLNREMVANGLSEYTPDWSEFSKAVQRDSANLRVFNPCVSPARI